MKEKLLPILILSLLFCNLSIVSSAYIIEPGYEYTIENETYRVNAPMNFSRVDYDSEKYIIFNNTGINITAPDNILITLRNLNGSTTVASINDELFEFEVLLDSGATTMSISGFSNNQNHTVYKDASLDTTEISNSTGCIEITIAGGVSYIYTVYKGGNNAPVGGGGSGTTPTPIISTPLQDTDGDGLTDVFEEGVTGTNPLLPDTDFDGYTDYEEYVEETDPLDPNDYPSEELGFFGVVWYLWLLIAVLLAIGIILFFLIKRRKKKY